MFKEIAVQKCIHAHPPAYPVAAGQPRDHTYFSRIQSDKSKSVVAIIPVSNLTQQSDGYELRGQTLVEVATKKLNLDANNTYEFGTTILNFNPDDLCVASATGFLVRPDYILTLAHCVPEDLNTIRITADFESGNQMILAKDMYSVREKIPVSNPIRIGNHQEQWVLLKLDRPMPRMGLSLKVVSESTLKTNCQIYMHGHPLGQSKATADLGLVASVESSHFTSTISGFSGNSGSPTFDRDNDVIGIFASGPPDFTVSSNKLSIKKYGPGDARQKSTHEVCLLLTQDIVDAINKISPVAPHLATFERITGEALSIANCFVNLAIVKESEQQTKESQKPETKRNNEPNGAFANGILGTWEDIHNPKQPIELADIFNLSEGLNPVKKIMILGRAGIGKSTLCQKIEYAHAAERLWAGKFEDIVKIKMREVTPNRIETTSRSHAQIAAQIVNELCYEGESIVKGQTIKDYFQNKLLIIDGLDESTVFDIVVQSRLCRDDTI